MNPARSFAPAFWNQHWTDHWVYWLSPLSAGYLTSKFYRTFFWCEGNDPESLETLNNGEIKFSVIAHKKDENKTDLTLNFQISHDSSNSNKIVESSELIDKNKTITIPLSILTEKP